MNSIVLPQFGAYLSIFTPDNTKIVTGSVSGTLPEDGSPSGLAVWSVLDGRQLRSLEPFGTQVMGIAAADNGIMAVLSDGSVKFYGDDGNGQVVGHHARAKLVRISQNSKFAATADEDGSVKIWDLAQGRLKGSLDTDGSVRSLGFSADSRILAIGRSRSEGVSGGGIRIGGSPATIEVFAIEPEGIVALASDELIAPGPPAIVTRTIDGNVLRHRSDIASSLHWSDVSTTYADLMSFSANALFPAENGTFHLAGGVAFIPDQGDDPGDRHWFTNSTTSRAALAEGASTLRGVFGEADGGISVHEFRWWGGLEQVELFRFRPSVFQTTSVAIVPDGPTLLASDLLSTRLVKSLEWPVVEKYEVESYYPGKPVFLTDGSLVTSVLDAEVHPETAALGAIYDSGDLTAPRVYSAGGQDDEFRSDVFCFPQRRICGGVERPEQCFRMVWRRQPYRISAAPL